MKAYLILEDGHVFRGTAIGAVKEVICELVFNTSMTGYYEILTDPSYEGQAVVMTYPLIGNYGICLDDGEADHPHAGAFILRELSEYPSNFRCEMTLSEYMKKEGVPGICDIDTRHLTRLLRESGTKNAMLTTESNFNIEESMERIAAYRVTDVVRKVTCREKYIVRPNSDARYRVALLDFGSKKNIVRSLCARGCEVTVYPAYTPAEEILAAGHDGIMLSNGPGDPADCTEIIAGIRKLYESDIPIMAICLGHQLMALACGFTTRRMTYGHRGANHPVKDLRTGRVYMSSQNHGYVVNQGVISDELAEVSFVNANDGTVEGLRYRDKKIFSVQFHPEACPGPQDTGFLFDDFIDSMCGKE